MFFPLALYAVLTLVAAAFSLEPEISLIDSKQLVVLLVVPIAYRLLRGRLQPHGGRRRSSPSAPSAPCSASFSIVILELRQSRPAAAGDARPEHDVLRPADAGRVRGVRAHHVRHAQPRLGGAGDAGAAGRAGVHVHPQRLGRRVLRQSACCSCCAISGCWRCCRWRSALFLVLAPPNLSARIYSTFSLTDPSNADRVAMMRSGVRIIKDHPLTGVGPDMIIEVYPDYRDATAVNALNPHLHNVPLQIAAERGLPALVVWLWFIVVLVRDLHQAAARRLSVARQRGARRGRGDARRRACSSTTSAIPSS